MTVKKTSLTKSATEFVTDSSGKRSGKRIITFAAFILMATGFVANLFWAKHMDADFLRDMYYIVLFGLGAITAEPVAQRLGSVMQPPAATPPPNPTPPPAP